MQHVGKLEYSQHLARAPCQRKSIWAHRYLLCWGNRKTSKTILTFFFLNKGFFSFLFSNYELFLTPSLDIHLSFQNLLLFPGTNVLF